MEKSSQSTAIPSKARHRQRIPDAMAQRTEVLIDPRELEAFQSRADSKARRAGPEYPATSGSRVLHVAEMGPIAATDRLAMSGTTGLPLQSARAVP